jgi:hypothetical protein
LLTLDPEDCGEAEVEAVWVKEIDAWDADDGVAGLTTDGRIKMVCRECLKHAGSSSGYGYRAVVDTNPCYQTWLDSRDWDGCPYPDPDPQDDSEDQDEANARWAEQQVLTHGGQLPVACRDGRMVLVEIPEGEVAS